MCCHLDEVLFSHRTEPIEFALYFWDASYHYHSKIRLGLGMETSYHSKICSTDIHCHLLYVIVPRTEDMAFEWHGMVVFRDPVANCRLLRIIIILAVGLRLGLNL